MSFRILARLADHPAANKRGRFVRMCHNLLYCLWVIAKRFLRMALRASYLFKTLFCLQGAALYAGYPILPLLERNATVYFCYCTSGSHKSVRSELYSATATEEVALTVNNI